MNRKIIAFLLCGTLLLSAAGCGASGKQADANLSKPVEETAEEVDAAVMDEAGDKLQEVEDSLSDASAEVEESLPEAAEEIIEESESEASASDDAMTLRMPSPMRNLTETRSSLFRMEK